ncbi:hypothetical protein [Tunicatimonas pelagia]|uniref:hypothetical protein n=1 Tax=Tunicatimonas pelagia TaxID=931531 RepID=UPI0026655C6D|nr:hypothetical protein [Tunicatimonas pelagia]WKN43006.1 hypothetical protein P0M28_28615 [Tunicatimonas pelagia]
MNSLVVLLLFSLIFGALVGFGLRFTVSSMNTDMSNATLVGLSGAAMLLFLPSWLAYQLSERYLAAVLIQLFVGAIAGMVSGYFWDSLLSCVLVGVMASLTLWITTSLIASSLYWVAGVVALLTFLLNVVGHSLGSRPLWVYLLLAVGTSAISQLTAWLAHKLSDWLTMN